MPVSQLLASMKTPAEGFTRYVRKVEVNRTKSTSMWVESGGAIFAYSKSAAAGVGNKASRYALVDLQEIRLGHKTQVSFIYPSVSPWGCPSTDTDMMGDSMSSHLNVPPQCAMDLPQHLI